MGSSPLSAEFKEQFALLLCVCKVNYNVPNSLNYAETLIEWTLGGLIADNKVMAKIEGNKVVIEPVDEKHADLVQALNFARERYDEALKAMKNSGQPGSKTEAQHGVLAKCFEVNVALFPIALREGLLDLKNAMPTAMSGLGAALNRDRAGGED